MNSFLDIYRGRTVARDLALRLIIAVVVFVALFGTIYFFLSLAQATRELNEHGRTLVVELSEVLSVPMWNLDQESIEKITEAYLRAEDVVALRVFDADGVVIYEKTTDEENLIVETHAIEYNDQVIGSVEIKLSQQRISELRDNFLFSVVGIAVAIVVVIFIATGIIFARNLNAPLAELSRGIDKIASGDYEHRLESVEQIDINAIVEQVNVMAEQIAERDKYLEQQVTERTQALEQRSAYLRTAAEISQTANSILDPDALIQQVVRLIRERFDFYYVGLFLVDDRGEWAVLQAGTGEAGRKMLALGHRLKIGEGVIGQCIVNGEARVALDVGEDAVRFQNPDLPETRSEVALPLRSRGNVLGALTVQSVEASAFEGDAITILQTMADQVAVALDNAELFAKSEAALESERRVYGELTQAAWKMLSSSAIPGYRSDAPDKVYPIKEKPAEVGQVGQKGEAIHVEGPTAIIPIKSHGYVLGGIKLSRSEDSSEWTEEQLDLAQSLGEQLSVALESARLYEDTQRRAAFERVTGEITSHFRESLDVDRILQTAASEFQNVLNLDTVEIRVGQAPSTDEMQE